MYALEIAVPQRYRLSFDKRRTRAVLMKAGREVAADARRLVRRSQGGGRVYYGSEGSKYRPLMRGRHTASLPGQPPANWTGALAGSIGVRPIRKPDVDGVVIRDTIFYALFLEAGAHGGIASGRGGRKGKRNPKRWQQRGFKPVGSRVLLPRPFLSTARDRRQDALAARVKAAVIEDVEFRRISAAARG